jgi:formate dehydrogenase maturation protein FdhE
MLKAKFIALLKALLLLGILLSVLLFNTDLSKPLPSDSEVISEQAVREAMELLQRDKIFADTAHKYRQQAQERQEKEYQQFLRQGQRYTKSLISQQQRQQQELDTLKQNRLQAEQELEKIRQAREELSHVNPSTD